MKLFRTSQGFIIAFGFDMLKRLEKPRMISWCDPQTNDWEPKSSNMAGYLAMGFTVNPEFVRECDGRVIAYQPGKCIEMTFIGGLHVWSVRVLWTDKEMMEEVA